MAMRKLLNRRDFLKKAAQGISGAALAGVVPPFVARPVAPQQKEVTISYWHIWGGVRDEQIKSVLADFTKANPSIKVEPLLLPNPGYADKILTGLAANPPDLTMIYTDEFAPSARRNALKPVDSMMAADKLTPDIWYPGVYNMSTWKGKAYGLPFVGNFLMMLYWAQDDYKAGGLDPVKGPETWDDMLKVAKTLTKVDGNKVQRLGYVPGGRDEWMQAVYRNGGTWYGDGTPEKVAVNDDKSTAALEYVIKLYEALGGWDAVGAATAAWGNQQLGNPLIAGVASTIMSGVFTVNIINQQKPDMKYMIGKLPKGPKGDFMDVITASWSNAIPAKAANPDAAWVLAKYLSAGDGHLKFMVDLQARPAMVKKYNVAPYDAAARKGNPYWDVVLEILNGKQATYPVSDKLAGAQKISQEAFESIMLKKRTAAEGIKWAQDELVKVFKEE